MKRFLFFTFLSVLSNATFAQQSKIDSLLSVLKTIKEDTIRQHTLHTLVWALRDKQGDYENALLYAKEELNTAEKINSTKGVADANYDIGTILCDKGYFPLSIKYLLKALPYFEKINDGKSLLKTYNTFGNIYKEQNNFAESLDNYLKALKACKGDKKRIGYMLDQISRLYSDVAHDYNKALEYQLKSLANREDADKKNIGVSLLQLGNIYYSLKNYPYSIEYFNKASQNFKEFGDEEGIAEVYKNIGSVFLQQGNYNEALLNNFSALKVFEKLGDKYNIASIYHDIGEIYFQQNKYIESEKMLNKALALYKENANRLETKEEYKALNELFAKQNNYKKAYEYYKLFSAVKDSLLNEENNKKTLRSQMQYDFDKKESLAKLEQDKKDAIVNEEKRRQRMFLFSVIGGLLLVIVFAGFIFRSLRVTRKQKNVIEKQKAIVDVRNKEVEEQKKLVEEKNKDITDSINYAQRIQRALLASESLLNKNLGEYFVFFKPKDIVSGDFYWATEKDGRFYLAVCDSTGHGVPGAFMSLLNISFLNEAIAEKGIKQPNEVFNHVRQRLIENISTDGAKDGMDGILVCFDRNNKSISYAGANNAPYLKNGTLQELSTDNMPVGLGEKKDSFTHNTISFQTGNILYLYTDGFADQFGGPKGKKFKYKPLNEILTSISGMQMEEQRNTLEHTFVNWKGSLEQVDDVLVIGVRL